MSKERTEKITRAGKGFDPTRIFIWSVSVSALVFILLYTAAGDGRFVDVFFIRCADSFMDFFNSIRDAAQWSEVYTERSVIYPPLANLIFLILSRFTPNVYNDTEFEDRLSFVEYPSPLILIAICLIFCAVILFYAVYRAVKGSETRRFLFALCALFSVPVMYMLERGNMIVLCLVALIVYAFTYRSESRLARELGLVALAFTFAIKLYPVIFGWFLIVDKRFKDALRCFLYGMAMLILPSFFFGGPACLYYVFANIFSFSSSGGGSLGAIAEYAGISARLLSLAAYAWCAVIALCFAVSPYVHREKWRSYTVGLVLILCVPSLTSLYSWAFILIPFIMLCNEATKAHEEKPTAVKRLYTLFMLVPFIYIPLRFTFYVSNNTFATYIFTAALSVLCVSDTAVALVRKLKELKKEGVGIIRYIRSKDRMENNF